jgi:hypothetical protein
MIQGVENKYSTSCPKLRGDVGDPRADGSLSHKYENFPSIVRP